MATNSYSAAGQALGFGRTDLGIGMSVPGANGLGNALQDQVKEETDEERKRRLLGTSPLQTGAGGISPAGGALFGSLGGIRR